MIRSDDPGFDNSVLRAHTHTHVVLCWRCLHTPFFKKLIDSVPDNPESSTIGPYKPCIPKMFLASDWSIENLRKNPGL